MAHSEHHRSHHIGWLRAAVLGANDGVVSTASLVLGVAGFGAVKSATVIAGLAGLVAGALSMAAGEYVSVSTQADTQDADLARERGSWPPARPRSTPSSPASRSPVAWTPSSLPESPRS